MRATLMAAVLCGGMTASSAEAQGFLRAFPEGGDAISMPLTEEVATVRIDGQFATTRLRQTYQNESGETVEGRYSLNVGTGARAQGFAYWNGEEKIVGEVFERQAARAIYEEMTGLGRDPGLLEEEADGTFSFRVFPITAGEPKRVEVTWGQWLSRRGNQVDYRAPLSSARATGVLRITDERPITSVSSSSHEIRVERRAAGDVLVHLGSPRGQSSALSLRYEVQSADWQLAAVVHRDAGHDAYLSVSVTVPEGIGAASVSEKDVTIVLDRSGSMTGAPLEQAKFAAARVIAELSEGDRLNVVIFDDQVEALYPSPREVSDASKVEATGFVERVSSRGGTDLAGALASSLAAQNDDARPHVILFLTDGQSDAQRALEVASSDQGDARIYTIGVGAGVERPLLSRLAQTKRGTFTYIESAEAIVPRMTALYEQIASPVLIGVEVEVAGARPYDRYPQSLPDLHRHQELRFASRLMGEGPITVRLRGTLDGAPFESSAEVQVPSERSRPWVGRVWATSKVDYLLEDIALLGETDERKGSVTELAVAYNFATPYTSFLAIPESEMTEAIRGDLEAMREARAEVMRRHRDAAALSRSAMPPGDPILRVHAPIDAVQVTAYFPFGLVKDKSEAKRS